MKCYSVVQLIILLIVFCFGVGCEDDPSLYERYQNSLVHCKSELVRHRGKGYKAPIYRYSWILSYLDSIDTNYLRENNKITSAIWMSDRPFSNYFHGALLFDWVADDPKEAIGYVIIDSQGERHPVVFDEGNNKIQDENAKEFVIYTYLYFFNRENPAPVTQEEISEGCKIALLLENGQESEYIPVQHKTEDGFAVKAEDISSAIIELPGEDSTNMVLYKVGPDLSLIPIVQE